MKKYLIILIAAIALVFSIWGYMGLRSSAVSKQVDVFTALPEVPYSLLRINNLSSLSNALLYDNSYWQDVSKLASFQQVNQFIVQLDSIKEAQPTVQSFLNNRTLYYASFALANDTVSHLWFAQVAANEWTTLEKMLLQHTRQGYFFAYENGIFLISPDKDLLHRSIQQIQSENAIIGQDAGFASMLKTAGKQAVFNWLFNIDTLLQLSLSDLTEQGNRMLQNMRHYARWCCFDGIIEGDKLILNGFADKQGKRHYTALMEGQEGTRNTLVEQMPYNTYFFQHLSLSDIDTFHQQLEGYALNDSSEVISNGDALETPTGESPLVFFREFFGGEIAYGWSPLGPFVMVKLIEPRRAIDKLQYMIEDIGYGASCKKEGGMQVYTFPNNGFAGCVFGAYYTLPEEYIVVAGNKLIIAPTSHFARYIASRKSNTQTLQCAPNFQDANRTLLTESNLSMYINLPYMVRNAERFVDGETLLWVRQTQSLWKNFSTFCLQGENDFSGNTFQHLFLQYNKVMDIDENALLAATEQEDTTPEDNSEEEDSEVEPTPSASQIPTASAEATEEPTVSENTPTKRTISQEQPLCTATLDYPAIMAPQVVKNHYTGENEIAIQDSRNQLYLISASGHILWKIVLPQRILGSISQIDLYKNNKLQMVFVTEKQLWVVDRNGKMVSGFPKDLNTEATQGLTVCDYDGNKNYRFFVTGEDGSISLLKTDGTSPADWQFSATKTDLQAAVQYLKVQSKDFLIAYDKERCYLLNRQGKERIHTQNNLKKATYGQFYSDAVGSNARIVATTPKGEIMYIYDKEVKTSAMKDYSPNHLFTLFKGNYGNYYLFLDEKGLDVYDRDMNLYMNDENVVAGKQPTLLMHGSKLAVYDTEQDCWIINNLVSKRKAYQIFASDTPLAYFGNLKPYASPCLVVTEGKELKFYKVREK